MKPHYSSSIKKSVLIAFMSLACFSASAVTQTVTVANFVFTPSSFTINLGDTVKWVWVNGTHTTTSLTIPGGAASWNSNINSSTTTFKYIPTVAGTYNYWCSIHTTAMMGSFTVVCSTPAPVISAGGTTTFCSGGSVSLALSTGSFSSYQWKKDAADISGATKISFSATQSGSYTLRATNSCGNSGTSNAIPVTVNTVPTGTQAAISAGGSTTFCNGGNVTLTVASAGLLYLWKLNTTAIPGATNQSFSATQSGSYTCAVSNSCGPTTSNAIAVTVNNCVATLNLKFFIEGYYAGGGMMQPVLFNEGIDPNPGSTNTDSVLIELHNATNTSNVAASFKGVVQTNGTLACTFPASTIGNSYYVVIHQRSAVESWSANPVTASSSFSYNFSTSSEQAYGKNMVEVETGVWALYSGDVDDGSQTLTQDGAIDISDFIPMDEDIEAGLFGYYLTDLNGDGTTDISDFLILDPNIQSGIVVNHP